MVAFVLCILQVIILFSCNVNSNLAVDEVNVHYDGSYYDQDHRRILVYTCTSRGEVGDSLSWYQAIGSNNRNICDTVTHTNTASNEMKLTLNLTAKSEINNTNIFCAKSLRGETTTISSNMILVTFPEDTPVISITPNTSVVLFDVNKTLEFICKGSKPVAGRKLTWFMQRPGGKPIYAEGQTYYDNVTYINNLVLRLNESCDGSRLYCAQAYVLHKFTPQGGFYEENSGPTVRSNNITLVQRRQEDSGDREDKDKNENIQENARNMTEEGDSLHGSGLEGSSSPLLYAIPIGVVALLIISAAAVWFCWRRRALEKPQDDEHIYATPQVQYATLDLQSPTTEYASSLAQEKSPYAKIIGIYRPK